MNIIGLISGTSLDGIDAVVVDIPDNSADIAATVQVLAFATYPYPAGLRERLIDISLPGSGSVDRICHLNAYVGELFAQAACRIAEDANLDLERVDAIGSHGQTIHHMPQPIHERNLRDRNLRDRNLRDRNLRDRNLAVTSTLQIGEPSIIAERTGVTTIADFRPRDMAADGQGAPFAPYAHHVLFQHPTRDRIITNIGGISNITYLPAGALSEDVVAFDTGPGNMILDVLTVQFSAGAQMYDADGQWAGRGTCSEALLEWMLSHPYFQRKPPKSTGREEFGAGFVQQLCEQARALRVDESDLLATAVMCTASSIAQSCTRWLPPGDAEMREMFCCGGGVKNQTLMTALQRECGAVPVGTVEALGVSSDALEAITFALLARATLVGSPFYLPNVTGARQPVLLGKIVPGRRHTLWKIRENI